MLLICVGESGDALIIVFVLLNMGIRALYRKIFKNVTKRVHEIESKCQCTSVHSYKKYIGLGYYKKYAKKGADGR